MKHLDLFSGIGGFALAAQTVWGDFLKLRLPSGRSICYHRPKITVENKLSFMAVNPVTNQYEVEESFGGKLVENATQAVARDIMVEAMFGLIHKKYQILFTVHDELVVEREKGLGSCEEVVKTVRIPPAWAVGCPINAECEVTERYQK